MEYEFLSRQLRLLQDWLQEHILLQLPMQTAAYRPPALQLHSLLLLSLFQQHRSMYYALEIQQVLLLPILPEEPEHMLTHWSTTPVQTTQTATGLIAGTYVVTVTDANSCVQTASVTITQPADLLVGTSQSQCLCFGNSTGTATAIPVGGALDHTPILGALLLFKTQLRQLLGLPIGTYTVTVTDANSCTKAVSVTITEPTAALTVSITQVDVLCFRKSHSGTATANPLGGTAPYTYS
ncbi:MAG: SprB repeat-containing protein [Sphingobacterium sp.]|nr:SprB repeat-containing protein [Sphingobacterium sp.]